MNVVTLNGQARAAEKKMNHIKSRLLVLIAISGMTVSSAFADGVGASGFVDVQLGWDNTNDYTGTAVADGALYFSKTLGNGEVKLDLPFAINNADTAQLDVGVEGDGIAPAPARYTGQAYVAYKYESGLRWKIGQWDTSFGYELNDSADLFFTDYGLLWNRNPVVHQGALVGYDLNSEMGLNFYAAAPSNAGTLLGSVAKDDLQFGAQFTYAGAIRLATGLLMTDADNMYFDLVVGKDIGSLVLDVEANGLKVAGGDMTIGVLAHAVYNLSETTALGLRFEHETTGDGQTQLAVGPRFAMSKDLNVKFEYLNNFTNEVQSLTVSAVHRF